LDEVRIALAVFDHRGEGVGVDALAVGFQRLDQDGTGGRGVQQARELAVFPRLLTSK